MESWSDQSALACTTGMVIPAYFSARPTDDTVYHLLWMTLGDCHHYVDLENVCVVVDGDSRTLGLAEQVRDRLWREHKQALCLVSLPENKGKLWAVQEGMTQLLRANPHLLYLVTRDGDGDHGVAEMPALVRAASLLHESYAHSRIIVLGARRSRHHPMGWIRGELETLLDQVTLDALAFALAHQGRALNLAHCHTEHVPDLSSGYKVYGRSMAEALFVESEPRLLGLSAHDYWHFGPETMPVVEAVLSGGLLAELQRLTWDGQPATSFGEFPHVTLYGELLAWVYARLEIPLAVAAQFYDNHVPHLALRTMSQGAETLGLLREYALRKLAQQCEQEEPVPAARPALPFM
jgi:hypothetical protein